MWAPSLGNRAARARRSISVRSQAGALSNTMRSMPVDGDEKKPMTRMVPPSASASSRSSGLRAGRRNVARLDASCEDELIYLTLSCRIDDGVISVADEINVGVAARFRR
jgi:hypothetical protein